MKTKKLTSTALFTAIIAITIMAINIPIPIPGSSGYLNAGEVSIFLGVLILGDYSAALAAALGGAIADLSLGYAVYAPITLVVKGLEALVATELLKRTKLPILVSLLIASIINPLGYFIAEAFLYGWKVSLAGLPANIGQSVFGALVASLIYKLIEDRIRPRS